MIVKRRLYIIYLLFVIYISSTHIMTVKATPEADMPGYINTTMALNVGLL